MAETPQNPTSSKTQIAKASQNTAETVTQIAKTGRPTVILQYWTDWAIGPIGHPGGCQSSNLSDLIIIGIPICPICQNGLICPICQKLQSCNAPTHPIGDRTPSALQGLLSHDYTFCPIDRFAFLPIERLSVLPDWPDWAQFTRLPDWASCSIGPFAAFSSITRLNPLCLGCPIGPVGGRSPIGPIGGWETPLGTMVSMCKLIPH